MHYAYRPTPEGEEPQSWDESLTHWGDVTDEQATSWAQSIFGPTVRVFRLVPVAGTPPKWPDGWERVA